MIKSWKKNPEGGGGGTKNGKATTINVRNNIRPANQPPVLLDAPAQRNLLANLGARGTRQAQLGRVGLDAHDLGARGRRANVHHQNLVLGQLGYLGLLAVGRLNAEQAAQQEVVDLELRVDGGQAAAQAEHEADEAVCAAQCGVDTSADACVKKKKRKEKKKTLTSREQTQERRG